jgi:hypothetical protein
LKREKIHLLEMETKRARLKMGTKPNPIIALSLQVILAVMENEQRKDL